jgi:putative copper resistance protein D
VSGRPDLVLAALHWVEYVGLLGGIGSLVVRRLARNRPPIRWVDPPMHVFLGVAFLGGLAVITVEGLEAGAVPGLERLARVAAEGIALALCVRGIPLVAPAAVFAAVLLPLASHAAAVQPGAGAEFADAIHVLAAAMWAGGILALASLHPPDGWRGQEARALLDRFGGVALIAFAVTALTGVLRASDQLSDLSGLWTTSYGEVLALKSLGVGIMLVLSAVAWRRGVPMARAEAALAVLVVGATSVLAAFPTPH